MGARDYASALFFSPHSLRKWRDRLDDGEVEIDWRAHLHPATRPAVGTSAGNLTLESSVTAAPDVDPRTHEPPARRYFTDAQKQAIAASTAQLEALSLASPASMGAMPAAGHSVSAQHAHRRATVHK